MCSDHRRPGLALTWVTAAPVGTLIASTAVIALLVGLSLSSLDRLVWNAAVNESVGMGGFLFSSFGMLGSLIVGLLHSDKHGNWRQLCVP